MEMLRVEGLKAGYHGMPVVHDICFRVKKGQVVAILGGNGAGKTTVLWSILGKIKPMAGKILFEEKSLIGKKTYEMNGLGISMVPEGRLLFAKLSVLDNLYMGAYTTKDREKIRKQLDKVMDLFPIIREKSSQSAGSLSGGEQQMVAIARGLMCDPKLLILDEPTLGLSPKLVQEVFALVDDVRALGVTVILVEQNAVETLSVADEAFLIHDGVVAISGKGEDLLQNEDLQRAYLGL